MKKLLLTLFAVGTLSFQIEAKTAKSIDKVTTRSSSTTPVGTTSARGTGSLATSQFTTAITPAQVNNTGNYRILKPGYYFLTEDLGYYPHHFKAGSTNVTGKGGSIIIESSNVILDFNNKSLQHKSSKKNNSGGYNRLWVTTAGVKVNDNLTNITIKNGSMNYITGNGIIVGQGVNNLTISEMKIVECGYDAIHIGGDAQSEDITINNCELSKCNGTLTCAAARVNTSSADTDRTATDAPTTTTGLNGGGDARGIYIKNAVNVEILHTSVTNNKVIGTQTYSAYKAKVDGGGSPTAPTSLTDNDQHIAGFYLDDVQGGKIHNCNIFDLTGRFVYGMYMTGVSNMYVSNISVGNLSANLLAYVADGDPETNNSDQDYQSCDAHGISANSCDNVQFKDCSVKEVSMATGGQNIIGFYSNNCDGCSFVRCKASKIHSPSGSDDDNRTLVDEIAGFWVGGANLAHYENCEAIDNSAGVSGTAAASLFAVSTADVAGFHITTASNSSFKNCTAVRNEALYDVSGRVAAVQVGGFLVDTSLTNCKFENIVSESNKGSRVTDVYGMNLGAVTDCSFSNCNVVGNQCTVTATGNVIGINAGAISNSSFDDCNVTNNTAAGTVVDVGGMFAGALTNSNFNRMVLSHNGATGAVSSDVSGLKSTGTVSHCLFSNCKINNNAGASTVGGDATGISVGAINNSTFKNVEANNNESTGNLTGSLAGLLSSGNVSSSVFANCSLSNNTCGGTVGGNCVAMKCGNITDSNLSVIRGNNNSVTGALTGALGGLIAGTVDNSNFKDCQFSDNNAASTVGSNVLAINIGNTDSSTFDAIEGNNNSAAGNTTGSVGGLLAGTLDNSNFNGCQFNHNKVTGTVGGNAVGVQCGAVTNCKFNAVEGSRNEISGSNALTGDLAGFYSTGNVANSHFSNCVFNDNSAGGTVAENVSGMKMGTLSNSSLDNVTGNNNSVAGALTKDLVGLVAGTTSNSSFNNCSFSHNSAAAAVTSDVMGMSLGQVNNCNFSNCVMSNNTGASTVGGNVAGFISSDALSNCEFNNIETSNNKATGNVTGSVWGCHVADKVTNCHFTDWESSSNEATANAVSVGGFDMGFKNVGDIRPVTISTFKRCSANGNTCGGTASGNTYGFSIDHGSNNLFEECTANANTVAVAGTNSVHGFLLNNIDSCVFNKCAANSNKITTSGRHGFGFYLKGDVEGEACRFNRFSNCEANNNQGGQEDATSIGAGFKSLGNSGGTAFDATNAKEQMNTANIYDHCQARENTTLEPGSGESTFAAGFHFEYVDNSILRNSWAVGNGKQNTDETVTGYGLFMGPTITSAYADNDPSHATNVHAHTRNCVIEENWFIGNGNFGVYDGALDCLSLIMNNRAFRNGVTSKELIEGIYSQTQTNYWVMYQESNENLPLATATVGGFGALNVMTVMANIEWQVTAQSLEPGDHDLDVTADTDEIDNIDVTTVA